MWGLIDFIGLLSLGFLVILIAGGYGMFKDLHTPITKYEVRIVGV
jgi:hypothetical protein